MAQLIEHVRRMFRSCKEMPMSAMPPNDPEHDESSQPPQSLPTRAGESPGGTTEIGQVVQQVDRHQIKHFVSEIKSASEQVGDHIVTALNDDQTVAVLTTVVVGPDGAQRIVSAALSPSMMAQVQTLLAGAQQERDEEVPCVGFHCYVRPKEQSHEAPEDNQ